MKRRIGVLAVQGAFAEHMEILRKLGVQGTELRQKSDFINREYDGLILPGGESTVMGKLLRELELFDVVKNAIEEGMPVFGTCAGMILLAKHISNEDKLHLAAMDITVKRNAYGRQLGSFHTTASFEGIGKLPMTFIRAPYIETVDEKRGVKILAEVNGNIVAARQNHMLVTSFHPELTGDLRIHEYFLTDI